MKRLSFVMMFVCSMLWSYGQVIDSETETTKEGQTTVMEPIRAPIDGTYKKIELPQRKPMNLIDPREADVLYAKLIWRVIDLREKMNHPLYYPKEKKGNWKSLMATILDAIDTSEANVRPLIIYDDEYVTTPQSAADLMSNMGEKKVQPLYNEWGEDTGQIELFIAWGPAEIFRYKLKEQWRIDKQRSVMDQRIMTLCPMFWFESLAESYANEDSYASSDDEDEEELAPVTNRRWRNFGYIYYNEIRDVFAVTEVFNEKNNAQRRTYDDIFLQRHFSSFIEGEENVQDNRKINEYIVNGLDQALEAERIKEELRVKEEDLWEF
ncbi:MAG: gliding motility protein GldN [Bacteroidales bacterium]|jgi:gliding motility associated protien GldN|nr:gliding motility protein GldN [Bacteroidales bacterium]